MALILDREDEVVGEGLDTWVSINSIDRLSAVREHDDVDDPTTRANRIAWETATQKHFREYEALLAEAATGSSLIDAERRLLRDILARAPEVVHLQSGHGLDDVALVGAGARSVVGGLQRGGGCRSTAAR